MIARIKRFLVLVILLTAGWSLVPVPSAFATHIRAGEIIVTRRRCSSLDFQIIIKVYLNSNSPIHFSNLGVGELNFGDGSPVYHPADNPGVQVPGFDKEFYFVYDTLYHTFPANGQYVISYFEHNRNGGILNMFNSVETPFYIETVINIDPFLGCDNSPRLLVVPLDQACTGSRWYHNPGAFDPDGDSLSFQMSVPKQDVGLYVNGYLQPNSQKFYDLNGINYGTANEDKNGPPSFSIDPVTGTIVWDAPGAAGEYNIAFIITEWRKRKGVWVKLGFVTRDMQIIVQDCANKRPELTAPQDICVEAGTVIDQTVFGTDPNFDSVKIEAFSQVFSLKTSPATFGPTGFQYTAPSVNASANFHWVTDCSHVKEQPYQVVFKITDSPPKNNGSSLVQFKTWNIRVVGPAPKWKSAHVNPGQRKANLVWQKYACGPQAQSIQVWRRIDSNPFTPPQCVTGMPGFLGYSLIALVSSQDTTYVDNNAGLGLAQGASYCYRLVAIFPLPQGGESYVSQEICLPPILADSPIITNVTIDVTGKANGQITVAWRSPFDANPVQFPPPYQYKVYRDVGFSDSLNLNAAFPGWRPDTVWVDTGLNTEQTVYNYRILAFDNTLKDSSRSATASTVRLELKPQLKEIELNWNAVVPWSNHTIQNPHHLIFRGPAKAKESDMVLIDSVDVNEKGYHFVDSGQYLNTPLKQTDTFCYRVLTRGGYGNPKIKEPFLNYSQIICAQPNDTIRPCKPALAVKGMGIDCSEFLKTAPCTPNSFSNTLKWNRPTSAVCQAETTTYNIYVANEVGAEFRPYVQNVKDTFFVDANLPSYARCYKISAVSRSGIESPLSDSFCFDNCPSYGLPNVFSPNGDKCNELFSAWSNRYPIGENGNDACGHVDTVNQELRQLLCARFVNRVSFTVYNRWGKAVFNYESGGERSIYIDWNGRDDSGAEVPAGVYYYIALVNFNVVDPSRQNRTYKGWVQVIRGSP